MADLTPSDEQFIKMGTAEELRRELASARYNDDIVYAAAIARELLQREGPSK